MIGVHAQFGSDLHDGSPALATQVSVLTLVLLLHAAAVFFLSHSQLATIDTSNVLSVSFAMAAPAPQAAKPRPQKSVHLPPPVAAPLPDAAKVPAAAASPAVAAAPGAKHEAAPDTVLQNTEPDYKASYLNNPPPAYPLAARRMAMQGRVVLNVEVLPDGVCGQINIHKSSGYAILDNAALQTVKSWRFSPASHAGHAINKWFLVPIQFSLKDDSV